MSIICTKCGGTNVSCEAMINPNNKEFINYTDEAFFYGWCESCKTGVILSDPGETEVRIQQEFDAFILKNNKEPHYVICNIVWRDTNDHYDVKIQLSGDKDDEDEEDDMFFYCHSLNGLKSLVKIGIEDFIVTEIYSFEIFG